MSLLSLQLAREHQLQLQRDVADHRARQAVAGRRRAERLVRRAARLSAAATARGRRVAEVRLARPAG